MAPKHDLRLPETNYAFFLACPEQPQSLQTLVNNTLEPSANSNTGIDAGFRLPCGHQQGFSVQRSILDPKDFIIIYLQRSVHQHGQADRIKRRTAVQIDRVLTLSATRRGEVESRPIQYNLVGFVSHRTFSALRSLQILPATTSTKQRLCRQLCWWKPLHHATVPFACRVRTGLLTFAVWKSGRRTSSVALTQDLSTSIDLSSTYLSLYL